MSFISSPHPTSYRKRILTSIPFSKSSSILRILSTKICIVCRRWATVRSVRRRTMSIRSASRRRGANRRSVISIVATWLIVLSSVRSVTDHGSLFVLNLVFLALLLLQDEQHDENNDCD